MVPEDTLCNSKNSGAEDLAVKQQHNNYGAEMAKPQGPKEWMVRAKALAVERAEKRSLIHAKFA